MPKPTKEQKEKAEFSYPVFSDSELLDFKNYLEKFRTEPRDLEFPIKKNGHTTTVKFPANSYIDELKWMREEGAIGKNGGVVINGEVPTKYERCLNKLEQLNNYIKRKEFREKKELEAYAVLADTMQIKDDF